MNRVETLSPTHFCLSVNACKQATPEVPEVTCTRRAIWIFARDASDMGYWPGGDIMASLLPVATHMQKLSYQR